MKLFPALLFALCLSVAHAESRTWTSTTGKTVEAEFVSSDGKSATLKLDSGKTTKIALSALSQADRDFVNAAQAKTLLEELQKGNYDDPWPKSSKDSGDYEVIAVKEGPDEFIYETPHFEFISDAKIGKSVIKLLSKMFEATYEANKALPLNNLPWRVKETKFKARLYEERSDYLKAGGPSSSAGVFISGGQHGALGIILVPFESLGVKLLGKTYVVDRAAYPTTLIHEITHQMMPGAVRQDAWVTEGSAEYVANSPYNNGRFNFANNRKHIIEKVTAYGKNNSGGRALGKEFKAPSLLDFMTMSYSQFVGTNSMLHYGLAPLIVYYFYHEDGKGDAARIKAYVKALQEGKTPLEAQKILLDGRSYQELQEEIAKYWRRAGVTINFAD